MKVLVVGGGGREHAILWKLSQSPKVTELYCAPGNGGISELALCVPIKALDIDGVVSFSRSNGIDLVVVSPDDPLAVGMVDALEGAGIRAFGPRKAAAEIEASKVFAKGLMKKYGIPTAEYEVFDDSRKALEYLEGLGYPVVVKADGLALGKGVVVAESFDEAKDAVIRIMEEKVFGESGSRVVIEEYLSGREVTVLAFTDGKTIVPMVSSQDHKRAFDNDRGPNTGGMGTFSPSPFYTPETAGYCMERIFKPTVEAMNREGRTFVGVLYFGLMLTKTGPKVLEYNARFGDPETQVVLPLLKGDLLEIFEACIDGRLEEIKVEWQEGAAACVIMASGGYPGKYETGYEISGLSELGGDQDIVVFHAGTQKVSGKYYTSGGRVLGVTAMGKSLKEAVQKAYDGVGKISFKNAHYRKDIGLIGNGRV